jgi:DNA-binding LytR/AlgR family response regulator
VDSLLNIAICDDENPVCERLSRLVKNQCEHGQVQIYHSGDALLAANREYDIYFLDIQMPGVDGMKTAERLRARQASAHTPESAIIFITALKEYMQDAFDVKALHYLVKPVDEKKFTAVFRRALADLENQRKAAGRYVVVKSGDATRKIFLKDIFYIESLGKKNILCASGGKTEYYGKLSEVEAMLGGSFFRCHRSYIVNMENISRYNADTITLANGETISIAQKKYSEFVRAYMLFAQNGRPRDV